MAQPLDESIDRKLLARILGHADLSLLLSPAIKPRILPRLQKSHSPRSYSNADWVIRAAACSFRLRGDQGVFLMRGLGNLERSRPMSDSLNRQSGEWSASIGLIAVHLKRKKPWPKSQGSGTTSRRVYGVAGETLCNSEEFLSWCLVKTT